jgi:pilus assembly protein CpaE
MLAVLLDSTQDPKLELIRQLVDGLGYVVRQVSTADAMRDTLSKAGPGNHLIVIPQTAATQLPLSDVIQMAARLPSGCFLIYVADAIGPDDYKALVRTGAADWVQWSSALNEIRDISRKKRAVQASVRDVDDHVPHVVTTFLGAGGGVGTTTLALETGIWIASQKGAQARTVAVIDLDPQDSVICDYVDLKPRVNLPELMRDPGRLDDYLLNIFSSPHPSGLHIFACDHQRINPEIFDPAALFALLNYVTERYQVVIVDAGTGAWPWVEGVLAHSDRIFLVARYSVPSVKAMTRKLSALRENGISIGNVAVVLNLCAKGLFGGYQKRVQIDQLFANLETFHVVSDPEVAGESVDVGTSIMVSAPRSGLAKDVRKVAEAIVKIKARV